MARIERAIVIDRPVDGGRSGYPSGHSTGTPRQRNAVQRHRPRSTGHEDNRARRETAAERAGSPGYAVRILTQDQQPAASGLLHQDLAWHSTGYDAPDRLRAAVLAKQLLERCLDSAGSIYHRSVRAT